MHLLENILYGIIGFYTWDSSFLLYSSCLEVEIQTHKPGRLTQNLIQDRMCWFKLSLVIHDAKFFFLILLHVKKKKEKKRNPTNFFKHRFHRLALYNICCRERVSGGGGAGRQRRLWAIKVRSGFGEMTKFSPLHETIMIKNSWYWHDFLLGK